MTDTKEHTMPDPTPVTLSDNADATAGRQVAALPDVPVPTGALVHLEVADDVAACERAGRDWSGSGAFYMTRKGSKNERFIDCPDCLALADQGATSDEDAEAVAGNRILSDALTYYAERRDMRNPKGWEHVSRVIERALAGDVYVGVSDEQVAEAREVLARLVRSDAGSAS